MPTRGPATGWEGTHGAGSIREDGGGRRGQSRLRAGHQRGAELRRDTGDETPAEISGQPQELASRLSDVEDSYLGRTGPGGPG